jgi:hypothetical protein
MITNNEISRPYRLLFLLFLIAAFANERIDTAKRPKTKVANVETVVCTDKPVKFCTSLRTEVYTG